MDYVKELRKRTNHMPLLLAHSVVVVMNEKEEVLLEERADDGYFDFPGGGIDLKESGEEAAKRELFEETSLIAEELKFFKVYTGEVTYYKYFNGDEIYGVDLVYICRKYSGSIKPQLEEVKNLKFYDIKSLPSKMSKRNQAIVEDLLKLYKFPGFPGFFDDRVDI